ncbi:NAD-dependent epimerase/dehydratase family protein [Oculatella sp. LEGE 06141]|uniref:NAD-dependent epimerase/dehydratase family protein n=1 Tax=Oculatella sp. LEGE 06141 TaxID=1828648 RepID=UPI00187DE8F8|nr:NAD-dependent epimerase/dehydratase family protein [Oculatella sp. LEGE 06141]MBE9177652.1 NAD-dependent epimerase/dehydratase family protein [Oculatella sp. LEGE 06141]
MRILIMGGTRFIGVYLTQYLVAQGHEVVLFNRGNKPVPVAGVQQIHGDRTNPTQLKDALSGESFDAIFDNNGRELSDTQPLADLFSDRLQHFVYVSSAGVYRQSNQMPHREGDPVDPKSRHRGKFETESYLADRGMPFTSIRPVYIYGPQNYNDLEAWFFDRIVRDRPIPIPGNGMHMTQLGHVNDLASAMASVLGNSAAVGQIYNISGDRYVTFDGLAYACAEAAGKSPDTIQLVHYDPRRFDFGKRKPFPLRVQHFFADIHKATTDLHWSPAFDLVAGLRDSFKTDYLASERGNAEIDFSIDDEILKQSSRTEETVPA